MQIKDLRDQSRWMAADAMRSEGHAEFVEFGRRPADRGLLRG